MEIGLVLIPVLIVVSGAVAYIGNQVGRATGRRRLTILGLRPRHTAHLITVITGMLITLITIASVFLVSGDARTGLFRLSELREQIDSAEARLREVKGGDIAYLRNQEVLREVIDGKLPQEEILQRLDEMRLRAVDAAVSNGSAPDLVTGSVLSLYPQNVTWEAISRLVSARGGPTIVRIVALENTLRGEPLRVFVQLVDRRIVYRKGAVLGGGTVDGSSSREQISRDLLALVDAASQRAEGRILSPPSARISDLPTAQLNIDQHRSAVLEVSRAGKPVRVDVTALADITPEMPLAVTFVVKP